MCIDKEHQLCSFAAKMSRNTHANAFGLLITNTFIITPLLTVVFEQQPRPDKRGGKEYQQKTV